MKCTLNINAGHAKIKMIKQALELSENEILIPFSAISKQGIDDVRKRLIEMMEDE